MNWFKCSLCCRPSQTAHRGPSAKQTESQSDASNAASAPANTSGPSGLKSKSSGKADNSDGEDWGREQEEEEEEEEDDEEERGPSEDEEDLCSADITETVIEGKEQVEAKKVAGW